MAEFDPRELDILEDALEELDQLDHVDQIEELASRGLTPALRERLGEYQDVLALCREAFPTETPADHVLAAVIAEAHEVSRQPKLRDGVEGAGGWRSIWERWRGTVLPGIALAGTAAAVLFLLEPNTTLNDKNELLTEASKNDRRAEQSNASDTKRSEPASEPTFESRGAQDPTKDPFDTPDADAGEDVELDDAKPNADDASDPVVADQPDPARKPSSTHKAKSAPAPAVAPAPAPEPMSKDETWTSLERGNAARRMGDCDRAHSIYSQIIAAGADSLAVARAKAGIGLCYEQDRRSSEANRWFDDARSGNPGIDAWISTQRDEQPLPGEKKKTKKAEAFDADSL
ncbi:hypothetical protein DB30_06688 [Enhygromyxa salina]|uniref:Tetratricopeptide repeat protein n=1 Tax=Enhygromyxa salina TaxID=215803 RepID=A0A0C2CY04_9BACT|nr:tetratricopeptide repeat protein [Enhygromyxa salina]KIG14540.1 hypothetical protein DB30_06688 [Enhygromyxa salina]